MDGNLGRSRYNIALVTRGQWRIFESKSNASLLTDPLVILSNKYSAASTPRGTAITEDRLPSLRGNIGLAQSYHYPNRSISGSPVSSGGALCSLFRLLGYSYLGLVADQANDAWFSDSTPNTIHFVLYFCDGTHIGSHCGFRNSVGLLVAAARGTVLLESYEHNFPRLTRLGSNSGYNTID